MSELHDLIHNWNVFEVKTPFNCECDHVVYLLSKFKFLLKSQTQNISYIFSYIIWKERLDLTSRNSFFLFQHGLVFTYGSLSTIVWREYPDMEFVQKFTPPDLRLKILHRQFHLISTVLVGKITKNEWKWRNLHRWQNFTLPPALTALTNSTSVSHKKS